MRTSLDVAHDWQLIEFFHENSTIKIALSEITGSVTVREANILFQQYFLYLNAEEALDAVWNQDNAGDKGFVEKYHITSSALARRLSLAELPFYKNSNHYRIITRDEIIHVVSNLDPIITVKSV
jgi:hypothetical protein